MTEFRIAVGGSEDGVPVVELHGEVDIAAAEHVEKAILELPGDPQTVIVDLRPLSFLDSSGLRALLAAHQHFEAADRRLVLVRGPEVVQRVFWITRVEERLSFVDDPADVARV